MQITMTTVDLLYSKASYRIDCNVIDPIVCPCTLQTTSDHEWYIHDGFTDSNGNSFICMHTGTLYNPYEVSTAAESGYFDDCTPVSQQRCAMGDLSGKLGTLKLKSRTNTPHKTYSFYDDNLHLLGPFTSE